MHQSLSIVNRQYESDEGLGSKRQSYIYSMVLEFFLCYSRSIRQYPPHQQFLHSSCRLVGTMNNVEITIHMILKSLPIISDKTRDLGTEGTGGTCPQDFAINKEVPFLFSGHALQLNKKVPLKCRAPQPPSFRCFLRPWTKLNSTTDIIHQFFVDSMLNPQFWLPLLPWDPVAPR